MFPMQNLTRIRGVLVGSMLVSAALLAGCGGSGDEQTDRPPISADVAATGETGTTAEATIPEKRAGTGQPGETGTGGTPGAGSGKKNRGRNPASAADKRDEAPDDAISDRPGGPKPPGDPQPYK